MPFERIDIDLANKPDWFLKISPLGKTPVLVVGDKAIFESAVILEYLEETQPKPLHPADPLDRAEHRAWIEFGSADAQRHLRASMPPRMRRRSRPRPRSSSSASRGWRRALPRRPGSTAKSSRWSMRCSARCSAISTCSTRSAISAFLQASRSSRAGAEHWRSGRRCARRSSADYPALLRDSSTANRAGAGVADRRVATGRNRALAAMSSQSSAAIFASVAIVFMLRAVPALAAGMTSFDCPMPSP